MNRLMKFEFQILVSGPVGISRNLNDKHFFPKAQAGNFIYARFLSYIEEL
jgi:hypothetical protein